MASSTFRPGSFVSFRFFGRLPPPCSQLHVDEWQLVKNIWATIAISTQFCYRAFAPVRYRPFHVASTHCCIGSEHGAKLGSWFMDSISYFFRRLLFRQSFPDQPARAPFVRAHHNLITKRMLFCVLYVCVCLCTGAAMITAPNEIHKFRARSERGKSFSLLVAIRA